MQQKRRTRRQILEATSALIARGRLPSVTEAADAAGVSRRTAYRYFPSQAGLLAESALEKMRPLMESVIETVPPGLDLEGMETRIATFTRTMQKLTIEHEQILRTVIHTTILEPAHNCPKRGTRRLDWIEQAVEPLRSRLPRAAYRRLVSSLALCVGPEAIIVFRDVLGMSAAQAIATSEWLARAALGAALHDLRGR